MDDAEAYEKNRQAIIEAKKRQAATPRVIITGVDMPIWDILVLLVKIAVALVVPGVVAMVLLAIVGVLTGNIR